MPGLLTAEECLATRTGMDAGLEEVAEILTGGIYRKKYVRAVTVIDPTPDVLRDIELKLEGCRERVSAAVGIAVGKEIVTMRALRPQKL